MTRRGALFKSAICQAAGGGSQKYDGFTLVELLVVIAIIGVLAALLMPALHKAIGQARDVACRSNQKQVSLAVFMYADDWNGRLPFSDTSEPWMSWIDRVGSTPGRTYWQASTKPWVEPTYRSGYIGYARDPKVNDAWLCPRALVQLPIKRSGVFNNYNYSFNFAMLNRQRDWIKGTKVMLGDGHVSTNSGLPEDFYFSSSMCRNGWPTQDRGYYPWMLSVTTNIWGGGVPIDYRGHGNKVALLTFTDGHVGGMTRAVIDSDEGLAAWSFP